MLLPLVHLTVAFTSLLPSSLTRRILSTTAAAVNSANDVSLVLLSEIPLPKRSVFSCLSADIVADNDVPALDCNRIVSLAAIVLGFLNNSTVEPAGTGIK